MDRSPMSQALYETESPQGEITGKGFPDHDEFSERRDNSTNGNAIQHSYPGGENPQNLHIMPGELSIGRCDGNLYHTNGEPNERGFTSLSGFYHGRYTTLEAAMRCHYFQGVVKTEYLVDSREQGEGGYSYLRAGSCSIVNNGRGDIFAGDLVAWRFPDTYETLKIQNNDGNRPAGVSQGLVYGNRAGTPMTKVLVEVERFDPTDYGTCLSAVWQVMNHGTGSSHTPMQGINGMLFTELYKKVGMTDAKNLSSLQEEALAFQNSLLMIGYIMSNSFGGGKTNLNAMGLLDKTTNKETQAARKKALAPLFHNYITDDSQRDAAKTDLIRAFGINESKWTKGLKASTYSATEDDLLVKLANDPLGMLMGAITSAQNARRSRIIGKAMSSASKSDTLHIMIGHFRNC